jgi:hypothetical protein
MSYCFCACSFAFASTILSNYDTARFLLYALARIKVPENVNPPELQAGCKVPICSRPLDRHALATDSTWM